MVDHRGIRLWQHDFNGKLGKLITKKFTILRLLEEKDYSALTEVAESMLKLYDEIKTLSDELFTELVRLATKKED